MVHITHEEMRVFRDVCVRESEKQIWLFVEPSLSLSPLYPVSFVFSICTAYHLASNHQRCIKSSASSVGGVWLDSVNVYYISLSLSKCIYM
jgi:hypothetical protein